MKIVLIAKGGQQCVKIRLHPPPLILHPCQEGRHSWAFVHEDANEAARLRQRVADRHVGVGRSVVLN